MLAFDAKMTTWINSLSGQSPQVDQVVIWITSYGVPVIILTVVLQWWIKTDRPVRRHVLISSGFSFLLGLGLNQIILLFIHRIRPYDLGVTHLIIERSGDFSFPSDHATATAAIAFAFLLNGMRKEGRFYLLAILVVVFSRIYVGTHFVSDILGGIITALTGAMLVKGIYRKGSKLDSILTKFF